MITFYCYFCICKYHLTCLLILDPGQFPSDWKKANVVPVFKEGDKQSLKNYRPIIFERLLYNQLFEFFIRNDLISQN